MKALVTGAQGFVGKAIVSELIENNFDVIKMISPKSSSVKSSIQSRTNFFSADITDSESFKEIRQIKDLDILIHSAGLAHQFGDTKKEAFDLVNVEGSRNVAWMAVELKVKHFILISSTAVYGINPNETLEFLSKTKNLQNVEIDELSATNPQTLYAQSKLEAEKVCREICEKNNLPLTIFRLSPVIGENNVGNVARLIESIDRKRFVWIGKGENIKSLIYKNDVARACVELARKKTGASEIFNLSAEPVKMWNFVNEIARLLDRKIPGFSVSENLLRKIFRLNSKLLKNQKIGKIDDTIEKWLSDDVYSAAKIFEKYGFETRTSIFEGVAKQIASYQKNKCGKTYEK